MHPFINRHMNYEKERRKKMEEINEVGPERKTEADYTELMKPIRTFYIAGVQHHQMKDALEDISVGDNLLLVPEPTNKYDMNAVRIEYARHDKQTMLGFVPMKFSPQITGLLEIGMKLECIVTMFDKSAKPWEQCKVEIKEFEKNG